MLCHPYKLEGITLLITPKTNMETTNWWVFIDVNLLLFQGILFGLLPCLFFGGGRVVYRLPMRMWHNIPIHVNPRNGGDAGQTRSNGSGKLRISSSDERKITTDRVFGPPKNGWWIVLGSHFLIPSFAAKIYGWRWFVFVLNLAQIWCFGSLACV